MSGALGAARCQDLGRALVDSCESKSVLTFAWDVFYIGHNYGVTGPKGRPSLRRRRKTVREAALCKVAAVVGASELHRPSLAGPPPSMPARHLRLNGAAF